MRSFLVLAMAFACSKSKPTPTGQSPTNSPAAPSSSSESSEVAPPPAAPQVTPDAGIDPEAETKRMIGEWQPVTASTLVMRYERNALAADGEYRGKKLDVIGIVRGVSRTEIGNTPSVILEGGDVGQEVRGLFPESEVPRLSDLEAGELVALHCVGDGVMMRTDPQLKNCSVAWDGIRKSEHLTDEQRKRAALREARSGEFCMR